MAIQIPYTDGFITPESGNNLESKNNKGQVNGYAPLDANAKVPTANLPDQASLDAEVDGKITIHNSATTSVHGIANTANLVLTNDSRISTIAGGSINTSNGGGSINLSNNGGSIVSTDSGGSLVMSGVAGGILGGSIVTSYNGGSIFTHGGWGLVGSNSSSGYYNSSYQPYYIGTELVYVGTIDMGGGIYPTLMYFTNGVGSQGVTPQIAPNYTGWGILGEESVLAYLSNQIGRNDIPIGDYWSQPGGSGSRIVRISLGAQTVGGYINTSNGGGAIDTRGTGSIQLGVTGTRTTLNGSASGGNKTITLPNLTGALPIALISVSTSLDFGAITAGDFADLTISLIGAATTDVAFVTCLSSRGTTFGKLMFEAFVGSANNVTIRAHNPTSGSLDPDAYNFKVCVIKTS